MVSITLLAHSGRVTAQTYDWTILSEKQLTSFSNNAELSVAISGDIAVVGDRNVSSLAGEVKLFQRVSNGNWNPLATLTASDAAGISKSLSASRQRRRSENRCVLKWE